MLRLLIYIVLGIVLYRAARSLFGQSRHLDRSGGDPSVHVDDVMIQDPVCGAYFPQSKAVVLKTDGEVLRFCSTECRDRYLAERS
jgi:YHS domain-containing protein